MIKALIIFGTGLYAGVYVAQNYEIDKVEDPKALYARACNYIKNMMEESEPCESDKKKK